MKNRKWEGGYMKRRNRSGYPVTFFMRTMLQPAWLYDKERDLRCGMIRHEVNDTIMIAYEFDYDGEAYYEFHEKP